ncbi:hypothetical protein IE077_001878, partial [Cardiosporidium cionae]
MDTTELLGSFEQVSPSRLFQRCNFLLEEIIALCDLFCIQEAEKQCTDTLSSTFLSLEEARFLFTQAASSSTNIPSEALPFVFYLLREVNGCKQALTHASVSSRVSGGIDGSIETALYDLQQALHTTAARFPFDASKRASSPTRFSPSSFSHLLSSCVSLLDSCLPLYTTGKSLQCSPEKRGGCFEWVDGRLLMALQTGAWLVLKHAHLCSTAVLDRLNSLLEPNGFLLLTETGVLRTIYPHPDFRIFFTTDTSLQRGTTLSAALRNRCFELFVEGNDLSVAYYQSKSPSHAPPASSSSPSISPLPPSSPSISPLPPSSPSISPLPPSSPSIPLPGVDSLLE